VCVCVCVLEFKRDKNVYLLLFLFLPLLAPVLVLDGLELWPAGKESGKVNSTTLIEVWEAEVLVLVLLADLEK
jgi:hypothetical protein